MRWLIILFLALPALADPFALKLLSEKKTLGYPKSSDRIIRVYEVQGTPFQMVQTTAVYPPVEIHDIEVFRGEDRETVAARSSYILFEEAGGKTATLSSYVKFDNAPDAKGIGSLVLQPLVETKDLKNVKAVLSYSNFAEMERERLKRNLPRSPGSYNQLVIDHSHFGRVFAAAGFVVDTELTTVDNIRNETTMMVTKEPKPKAFSLLSTLGECWAILARSLGG